jgi:hypothetical protein
MSIGKCAGCYAFSPVVNLTSVYARLTLAVRLHWLQCVFMGCRLESDVFAFRANAVTSAFKANAVFVASVVANPVKSVYLL